MNRTSYLAMCIAATSLIGCGAMDDEGAEEIETKASNLSFPERIALINAKAATVPGIGAPANAHADLGNGAKRDYLNNFSIFIGDAVERAHEVHGFIRGKYLALNAQAGVLGYPTTDEGNTWFNAGKFNAFQFGKIVWRSGFTAREVHGCINDNFTRLGSEVGMLGWPITDEHIVVAGRRQNNFEFGRMYNRGGSCLNDGYPVLTANNTGNRLIDIGFPRITGASFAAAGLGASLSVSGAGFTPGALMVFSVNNPDFTSGVTGVGGVVAANGTFAFNGNLSTNAIRKINGLATVEAVEQSSLKRAVRAVATPLGSTFGGTP
jgi:hypothetical protein